MTAETLRSRRYSPVIQKQYRKLFAAGTVTLFGLMFLTAYLSPFGYMVSMSLKNRDQLTAPNSPFWPAEAATFTFEDEELDIYLVPLEDGIKELALVKPGREESQFIDPSNVGAGPITWEGKWRQLDPAWQLAPKWDNYSEVWNLPSRDFTFMTWLVNTFSIAILGIIGTVISCTIVAYGFSRFRIPGKNALFLLLISTLFLPRVVVTVPTYAFFVRIGWNGTWLPLIIPHFFANAYNVFWIRQYLMTVPREMDEAAMIDGANPLQTLWYVIIPQIKPALVTVALTHMVFAFRDFFEPLIYLATEPELQPLSVGINQFNSLYGQQPMLIQTAALLGLIIPVVIFFFSQRVFLRGLVFTGVEK